MFSNTGKMGVPRGLVRNCLTCGLGALLLATASASAMAEDTRGQAMPLKRQVALRPSPLVTLARNLRTADEQLRSEFAVIALQALRDSYAHELEVSAQENPSSADKQAKLARWQRGTRDLISQLDVARDELALGAAVNLQVDATRQVILLVGARPVIVAAPSPSTEREIERVVVAQFCAFNDCGFLDHEATASTPATAGVWSFSEGNRPAYAVGTDLRCEFTTLADRRRKEAQCARLWEELERLAAALAQARDQGNVIAWDATRLKPAAGGDDALLMINAQGAYLRLPLPLLSGVNTETWLRIVDWLRRRNSGGSHDLSIALE